MSWFAGRLQAALQSLHNELCGVGAGWWRVTGWVRYWIASNIPGGYRLNWKTERADLISAVIDGGHNISF